MEAGTAPAVSEIATTGADERRNKPFIWPTWISGLLAGTDRCWWKAWYRAHFKARKREDPEREGFLAEWTRKHDAMVLSRASGLEAAFPHAAVEIEKPFKLVGQSADLAGKPDITVTQPSGSERRTYISECKSGRPRESDEWQLKVYLFALGVLRHQRVDGEVWYGKAIVPDDVRLDIATRAICVGAAEERSVVAAIRRASAAEEPPRVPSAAECSRCDIAACPDRADPREEGDAGALF